MDYLSLIIGIVLGVVIAFLFFRSKQAAGGDTSVFDKKINELEKDKLVLKTQLDNSASEKQRLNSEKDKLNEETNTLRNQVNEGNITIAKARETFKAQDEKYITLKTELENVHKKYTVEFENIANKILDTNSKKFVEQNKTSLDIILNPLKEKIKDFEAQVQKAYKTESDERITLKTEIKNLVELNQKISDEANNLARALKGDNKMQGNWGEHILENIFERSGLIKDQEYKKEFSATDDEGARNRPDFVVFLPGNKQIIVDSKVSLIAYERCVNSTDIEEREKYIKEHIASVRKHVKDLSERNYQTLGNLNTPDFVLLFIPIESSFSVVVQADNELFNFAFDKKIVIVSPSTLLATLGTIASMWKQERQTKNAIEIAKQSGALYDKFVGFIEDMDKIGKSIDASRNAYESAVNKLHKGSGNLVKRAQDIEKLGAKTTKQLASKFNESDDSSALTEE